MRNIVWLAAVFLVRSWAQEPVAYASYLGGEGVDSVGVTLALPSGAYLVAGSTTSREGLFASPYTGPRGFFARYSQDNRQEWIRIFPSVSVISLRADSEENVYLLGNGSNEEGLATQGAYIAVPRGGGPYVAKFRSDGEKVWASFLSANGAASAAALAVDNEGRSAVCGFQWQGGIERTSQAFLKELPNPNASAGYCLVLRADGTQLEYSTYLADSPDHFPGAAIFDADGKLRVVGRESAWGFPRASSEEGEDPRRNLFRFDSGSGEWSAIGGAEFQGVGAIGSNPSSLAWDAEGGFFRMGPDGPIRKGPRIFAQSLTVHPLNPDQVCAITNGSQFQCSLDGGANWQTISFSATSAVTADPTTPDLFYFVSGGNVAYIYLRARPGGGAMQFSGIGLTDLLAIGGGERRDLLAVTSRGELFRARGGGTTFERVSSEAGVSRITGNLDLLYGFRLFQAAGRSIFRRSFDGGETWTDVGPGADGLPGPYVEFRADAGDPRRIALRTVNGLWLSEDGAETWRPILEGLANRQVAAIGFGSEGQLMAGSSTASIAYCMKMDWREGRLEQLLRQPAAGSTGWNSISSDGENGFRLLGFSAADGAAFIGLRRAPREGRVFESISARIDAAGELVEGTAWGVNANRAAMAANGEVYFWLTERDAAPSGMEVSGGERTAFNRDLLVSGGSEGPLRGAWIPSIGLGGAAGGMSTMGDVALLGGVAQAERIAVTPDAHQPVAGGGQDGAVLVVRLPR